MIRDQYALVDCSYLAHRAFHSTGSLRDAMTGQGTGIIYGVLRDLASVARYSVVNLVVCCFDRGPYLRSEILPMYKKRRVATPSENEFRKALYEDLDRLANIILPALGFTNILQQQGFEADDWIAAATKKYPQDCLIVSSDQDLYQLLDDRCQMLKPAGWKFYRRSDFVAEWGIDPSQWPLVKAIAGCRSDNVPGVPGVGEKTARDFIAGKLLSGKKFDSIVTQQERWNANKQLVELPFAGTPEPTLYRDETSAKRWNCVMRQLKFRSLEGAWND